MNVTMAHHSIYKRIQLFNYISVTFACSLKVPERCEEEPSDLIFSEGKSLPTRHSGREWETSQTANVG